MEIKTLAQILGENTTTVDTKNSKRSAKKKQQQKRPVNHQNSLNNQQNNQGNRQFNNKPHQQTNKSARGCAAVENKFATLQNSNKVLSHHSSDKRISDKHLPNNSNNYRHKIYKNNKQKHPKKKPFHPAAAYQPNRESAKPIDDLDFVEPNPNTVKAILTQSKTEKITHKVSLKQPNNKPNLGTGFDADIDSDSDIDANTDQNSMQSNHTAAIDNLPAALKAYLKTPEQREAQKEEIKANSRLRWLAFYYLSRREHSQDELRQKLLDKDQDPAKIEALLKEFSEKGYQSDYRTAIMLIREGIRKHRGRMRIKSDFYKRKIAVPVNIDELIDMAMADNEAFVDVLSDNNLVEGVDWLQLAVEARVKKYGHSIPSEPKEKARQLRFLQYRGFKPDICFQAITLNLDTLDDRF